MSPLNAPIGTVTSDADTPTFEVVRIKLNAGSNVRPNTLVRIPASRNQKTTLIGRIRSAHEHNPNEDAQAINLRETLELDPTYPEEEESTIIFRQVEAELVEELYEDNGKLQTRSPETLPQSGSHVFLATNDEIVATLGLATNPAEALYIGDTITGIPTKIILKREAIQRHFFVGGTTGSGKSYAMGVLAEELRKHDLPILFVDTQDEYSSLVEKLGGLVRVPGRDFNIRVSSLTERELISLVPAIQESEVQRNIVAAAFNELTDELADHARDKFSIDDLVDRIRTVGPSLTRSKDSVELAARRTAFLKRNDIFGEGVGRENWPKTMHPCLSIRCKTLTSGRLQTVATAVLRELQDLRLRGFIPPYVAVIDEAHLFVPEGEGSPCKQIIREGVRIGRHHGICMVLLTQSPVDIDKSVIRQCNTRMIFALEPDQLDAIRGVKSDASEAMLTALPKMPQGTCLLSGTYESVKHSIPIKVRLRETKESEGGKTPDIFKEMADTWKDKVKPSKQKKADYASQEDL
jgi:DNA helicase HerA-like ATPase